MHEAVGCDSFEDHFGHGDVHSLFGFLLGVELRDKDIREMAFLNAQAGVERRSASHSREHGKLKAAACALGAHNFDVPVLTVDPEEVCCRLDGDNLVTLLVLRLRENVQHGASLGKNIETEL